jgi:hypothetical protein
MNIPDSEQISLTKNKAFSPGIIRLDQCYTVLTLLELQYMREKWTTFSL